VGGTCAVAASAPTLVTVLQAAVVENTFETVARAGWLLCMGLEQWSFWGSGGCGFEPHPPLLRLGLLRQDDYLLDRPPSGDICAAPPVGVEEAAAEEGKVVCAVAALASALAAALAVAEEAAAAAAEEEAAAAVAAEVAVKQAAAAMALAKEAVAWDSAAVELLSDSNSTPPLQPQDAWVIVVWMFKLL
jgi:hypothetical protein